MSAADPSPQLSHVSEDNQPTMVDVGDKAVTARTAHARARVTLPPPVCACITDSGELQSKKGPVFQTAIIAGTMACKRTSDTIPFCHPLPLESVKINIALDADTVVIDCRVRVTHKTGVEMEALTGATAAALTVYDMCKALSHDIVIRDVRLIEKTGGKRDFRLQS
jgi:cyclic pyranopterin phosphate synthase